MKTAVLLNDTRHDYHHGGWIVTCNIISALQNRGIKVIYAQPVGAPWSSDAKALEAIKTADFVIVNGEGTIHHDQPQGLELVKVATHCKDLGKPVFLVNALYEANSQVVAEHTKLFDKVFVRESKSWKALSDLGISSEVVPDMTFWFDKPLANRTKRFGVGVTDSIFPKISEELFLFGKTNNYRFMPILRGSWFRPFIYRSYLTLGKFSLLAGLAFLDRLFLGKMKYMAARRAYYQGTQDYVKTLSILELLVTGRFHGVCLALKYKTPFLCLSSNSHKVEALLSDVGLSADRIVRSVDEIDKRIASGVKFTPHEELLVEKYTLGAKVKIDKMFDEICRNLK